MKGINAYKAENGEKFPEKVLIYRDGVNSGQYDLALAEAETIVSVINSEAASVKMDFVVVQKRVTTKLLQVKNWSTDEVKIFEVA